MRTNQYQQNSSRIDLKGIFILGSLGCAIVWNIIEYYGLDRILMWFRIALIIVVPTTFVILILVYFRHKIFDIAKAIYEILPRRNSSRRIKLEESEPISVIEETPKKVEVKEEKSKKQTKKKVSRTPKKTKPKKKINPPSQPMEEETEKEEVIIKVNEEQKFHKFKNLNEDEVTYLTNHNFKIKNFFNPFNKRKEKFVFKTNGHEGDNHFLLTHIIADFLKGKVSKIETFETVKPDIIFEIKNNKITIEVETGKMFKYNKKQLLNKVELLKNNYNSWFFVVMNRNFVRKYRQFGKTIDIRYLKNQLEKTLKKLQNSPN
jgi:hypothetical protein